MTLAFRQFGELATLCTEFIQSSSPQDDVPDEPHPAVIVSAQKDLF